MNRVLICARGYPPDVAGGGEISTELIARGLRQLDVDVHVLTFTDQESFFQLVDDVPVHRLNCPNIYWSIHASRQPKWKKMQWHGAQAFRRSPPRSIQEAVSSIQPTILHTSTIEDFGPGVWRWAKSQRLTTVHSLRSYNLLHRQGTLYNAEKDIEIGPGLLSVPKRYYAKSVDGVIGISDCILGRHLENGFFLQSKKVVIGNPIDQPITDIRPRSGSPIRLGILGRISAEKGIASFLQCLQGMKEDVSWKLDIAGDGPEDLKSSLQELAADLPVRWLGWKPSREFLMGLDLLVVPSRWHEPFGRIVVEAYSIGLPVLCLRRGAMPELVDHGRTGWIVDQWHTRSIKEALLGCRQLDRQTIRSVAEKYTIERVAKQHADYYNVLTESDRSSD